MSKLITAEEITDHAGAYHEWFYNVESNGDGSLTISGENPDAEGSMGGTFTAEQLTKVVADLYIECVTEYDLDSYQSRFYRDLLSHDDCVDGDMNAVDTILQTALYGKPVFG